MPPHAGLRWQQASIISKKVNTSWSEENENNCFWFPLHWSADGGAACSRLAAHHASTVKSYTAARHQHHQ